MTEEWRPIDGWPYEVSNQGRVRRTKTRRLLRPCHCSKRNRHLSVVLTDTKAGKVKTLRVHRLVCAAFNGPPPFAGAVVRHLDGVDDHNEPSNLAWGTPRENTADWIRHTGRPHPGRTARVSNAAAIDFARSGTSARTIAQVYGIALRTANAALQRGREHIEKLRAHRVRA